jgi:hypothetical protein
MATLNTSLDTPLPTGVWTLYFHAPREKRWTLDTFQPIAKMKTLREVLAVFQELGDKLKRGMFFCMRDPIPPLWENYLNIRGGSYSLRGGLDEGGEYFKAYCVGSMLGSATVDSADTIQGISISPKIMTGPGGAHRVGFYVIKVWNKDSEKFKQASGIHLLHAKLVPNDVLYTPHVEKKM